VSRPALRDRVQQFWIEGVAAAPHRQGRCLPLALDSARFGVTNERELLAASTGVVAIAGAPGSGKTGMLVELARRCLESTRVTLVLDLAEWSGRRAIAPWVAAEAQRFYRIPRHWTRAALETGDLVLLLDNFDALDAEARRGCARALADLPAGIVCFVAARSAAAELQPRDTVEIRPLARDRVREFLERDPELAGLRGAWARDPALQTLSRRPLLLELMASAYRAVLASDLLPQRTIAERREAVFADYIERQLREGDRGGYSRRQLRAGLSFLARKLDEHGRTVLFVDRMQQRREEDWLDGRFDDQLYALCIWLVGGAMTGPIIGLTGGLLGGLALGWLRGPVGGALLLQVQRSLGGAVWMQRSLGQLAIAHFRLPLEGLTRRLAIPVLRQPLWQVLARAGPRLLSGTFLKKSPHLTRAAAVGVAATVTRQLPPARPNQRIWQAARNALWWGLGGATAASVIFAPTGTPWWYAQLAGLLFGLFAGGIACAEHLVLRVFLTFGAGMPWNLAQFLDAAVACGLLYRIGSGYSFVHRDLQAACARLEGFE